MRGRGAGLPEPIYTIVVAINELKAWRHEERKYGIIKANLIAYALIIYTIWY